MDEGLPSFPNYDPVNPRGVPLLPDPRQQKPLMKMIKVMMTKPKRVLKFRPQRMKRKKFY